MVEKKLFFKRPAWWAFGGFIVFWVKPRFCKSPNLMGFVISMGFQLLE